MLIKKPVSAVNRVSIMTYSQKTILHISYQRAISYKMLKQSCFTAYKAIAITQTIAKVMAN